MTTHTPTDAAEVRELLEAIINDAKAEGNYAELEGARVKSFGDAMVLTSDEGMVIRFKGGVEFQITIVRSR